MRKNMYIIERKFFVWKHAKFGTIKFLLISLIQSKYIIVFFLYIRYPQHVNDHFPYIFCTASTNILTLRLIKIKLVSISWIFMWYEQLSGKYFMLNAKLNTNQRKRHIEQYLSCSFNTQLSTTPGAQESISSHYGQPDQEFHPGPTNGQQEPMYLGHLLLPLQLH